MFKSGFVSLIGRPNVGKSTLMNSFLQHKVAIMSNKAQTTRNRIQGIYTDERAQIIFIDTPGIHKPRTSLSNYMNKSAYSATRDVDIILLLINADEKLSTGDKKIIESLQTNESKVFLVLTKIDLISKGELYDFILKISETYPDFFSAIIPISAKKNNNVDYLLNLIIENLPEGIKYYPDEMISDHPETFLIKEIIREKILHLTGEEIPHSSAIEIEAIKKRKNAILIQANIIVERDSQKGIIIGKHGQKIKQIGQLAREELEEFMDKKIFLELRVKVEKDWRNRQYQLNELGYNNDY